MITETKRFITVVQLGSFTKSAQKLFVTQPALSLSIQRLEKELGITLFRHSGRHISLTSEGEAFYQVALHIQKLWDNAHTIKTMHQLIPHYSIGLYDNAALRLSSYFQKKLTKQRFEITIDRSLTLLKNLNMGIYDLVICVVPQDVGLFTKTVLVHEFSEPLIPVSGTKWKKEIGYIPFILYNKDSETERYIDQTFLEQSIQPSVSVESTDPAFMRQLALGNCGVAILPKNIVEHEIKRKKLFIQKFPFKFSRKIGVFVGKNSSIRGDKMVKEIIRNL